jgi:hypothetical protein
MERKALLDRTALLSGRSLPERTVEIPGVGEVRIRALSRAEVLNSKHDDSPLEMERRTLSLAMVDPAMTIDDVAEWQRVSPLGEISIVADAINELSGVIPGAAKKAYKSV